MNDPCPFCGKRVSGVNYCGFCGADLSPEAVRHGEIMRSYHDAARRAVRKAKYDRRLYGDVMPLEDMVKRVVSAMANPPEERVMFPAISGAEGGYYEEKLRDMALSRL